VKNKRFYSRNKNYKKNKKDNKINKNRKILTKFSNNKLLFLRRASSKLYPGRGLKIKTIFNILNFKLSKLYSKSVEIKPIKLHYPYLNSDILNQYLASNIKLGKLNKIPRKLFKKAIPIIGVNKNFASPLLWKNLIKFSSILLDPQCLAGIKIKISGRVIRRIAASRTKKINKILGSFRFGRYNSLIDFSKYTFKTRNGMICTKVWLSSSYKTIKFKKSMNSQVKS
jgi:Mitochondrial ribosomal protein (VAR1)